MTDRPAWLDPDRWGPARPPPPVAPAPAAPGPPPRSHRAVWLVVLAVVLAAVLAAALTVAYTGSGGGSVAKPDDVVRGYLRALADGDAAAALRLGPAPGRAPLLTDSVLRRQQQLAPIRDVRVLASSVHGGTAEVRAAYRFGRRRADQTFALNRAGHWQLQATALSIDVSTLSRIPEPTVFGVPIGAATTIQVFPGPLVWGSANRFFRVTDRDSARFALSPADPDAAYTALSAGLNADGQRAVLTAVQRYLAGCAASHSLTPKGCPQQQTDEHVVANSARWQVTSDVPKALRARPSSDDVTTYEVQAGLFWRCSYRVYASARKVVPRTQGGIEGDIDGSVDLTAATPAFTPLG